MKKQRFPSLYSFPTEVLMNGPSLILYGDHGCSISGVIKILSYKPDEVMLATSHGPLKLLGKELHICEAGRENFIISGKIHSLFSGEQ